MSFRPLLYALGLLTTLLIAAGCASTPISPLTDSEVCAIDLEIGLMDNFGEPISDQPGIETLVRISASMESTPALTEAYRQWCEEDDAVGCVMYGLRYYAPVADDAPVQRVGDRTDAVEPFLTACQLGFGPGCTLLGLLLNAEKDGSIEDDQRARGLMQRGCRKGDSDGCAILASMVFDKDNPTLESVRRRHFFLERGCLQGSPNACYELGIHAQAFTEDHSCFYRTMRVTCDQGHVQGCARMAAFHASFCEQQEGTDEEGCQAAEEYVERINKEQGLAYLWQAPWQSRCREGDNRACHIASRAGLVGHVDYDASTLASMTLNSCGDLPDDCGYASQVLMKLFETDGNKDHIEMAINSTAQGCANGSHFACKQGVTVVTMAATHGAVEFDVDPETARELIRAGCQSGDPDSCSAMRIVSELDFDEKDHRLAANEFHRRCQEGDDQWCYNAATSLLQLGEIGPTEARPLLERGCASMEMETHLCAELDERPDAGELLQPIEDLAAQCLEEDPTACDVAGHRLARGEQAPVDRERAEKLWQHGCDSEYVEACLSLGRVFYFQEYGYEEQSQRGFEFFDRACEIADHSRACFDSGAARIFGPQALRDLEEGQRLLDEACSDGHTASCNRLAQLYYRGDRVDENRKRALSYFDMGCEHQDTAACVTAGQMLRFGDGISRSAAQAANYFERACEMDDERGCLVAERFAAIEVCLQKSDDVDTCHEHVTSPAPLNCHDDNIQHLPEEDWDNRAGAGIFDLRELTSSPDRPVETCGTTEAYRTIAALRCNDGSRAVPTPRAANEARRGNIGRAGRCHSVVDVYEVPCPEKTYEVYVDSYVCPKE